MLGDRLFSMCGLSVGSRAPSNIRRAYGFGTDVWNREQLRIVIEREFGIAYSLSHLNRIVRDLGLSDRLAVVRGRQGTKR
jgi:transposase